MSENAAILRALQSHLGQKLILDFLHERKELDELDRLCCSETFPRTDEETPCEADDKDTDEETPCEADDEDTDKDQCFPVSGSAEETTWQTEQVNLHAFAFSDHWVPPQEEA